MASHGTKTAALALYLKLDKSLSRALPAQTLATRADGVRHWEAQVELK